MSSCRFCGESNLTWERTLNNKWILLDQRGQKHYCIKPKMPGSPQKTEDFKNDPKIKQALEEFKEKLNTNGRPKKTYWLKKYE